MTAADTLPFEDTMQARFDRFHADNPQVFATLHDLAIQLVGKGETRIGIKMLFEVVRFRQLVTTTGESGFVLNNSLTSRYARLLMDSDPRLAGVFETRALTS